MKRFLVGTLCVSASFFAFSLGRFVAVDSVLAQQIEVAQQAQTPEPEDPTKTVAREIEEAKTEEAPAPVGMAPAATPVPVQPNFTLGWTDPNPQGKVTGYKVKYGTVSGTYPTVVDVPGQAPVGQQKTKAFTAMPLGALFFVVTAYNSGGIQSAPTAELPVVVSEQPLTPGAPGVVAGEIVQFNTRSKVGTGNEQMASSFKVESQTKVAIRALGPSLLASLKPVPKTILELRDTNGVLIEGNNGWKNGPDAQELRDLNLNPPNDKESALVATVEKGTYNVTVTPGTKTGVGQIEIYKVQ